MQKKLEDDLGLGEGDEPPHRDVVGGAAAAPAAGTEGDADEEDAHEEEERTESDGKHAPQHTLRPLAAQPSSRIRL